MFEYIEQKNLQKSMKIFECKICDYTCSKQSEYNKHVTTGKHLSRTKPVALEQENLQTIKAHICKHCNKEYKARSGLWYHEQKCEKKEEPKEVSFNLEESIKQLIAPLEKKLLNQETEQSLIPEIIKQSQELQKQNQEFQLQMFTQIIELMKQQCATTNNINNGNINNNYNQFNLQVYLNETCKNAMTLNQFLDYLQPTIEELEATAHLGYVESISRIIMRGFKNLEEEELPFHCTDLKREHIYVKNPDKEWVKETDDKPLLLRFVKEVSKRNFNNIFAWQKQNPTWSNYSSKKNDLYNSIVENAMSGATEKEQNDNYEKIMKNIMKNIVVDKSKKNSKRV